LCPTRKAELTKGISFGSSAVFPSQRYAAFRPVLTGGLAFREVRNRKRTVALPLSGRSFSFQFLVAKYAEEESGVLNRKNMKWRTGLMAVEPPILLQE
jgi:hypothetical protein